MSSTWKSLGALVGARIVYAINWLNIGPIYDLMRSDIGGGVVGLGALTAAFYLGLGVMQVPGGILASRVGPRRVAFIGITVSSIAVLGTAVSGSIAEAGAFRLAVGAGMAFTFAPAVTIVAAMLKGERSGAGVGLYNSAFDFGGLFGLFGWVVLAGEIGWRTGLEISGLLGIATGLLVYMSAPKDIEVGAKGGVGLILRDKRLVLVGLGAMGTSISVSLVSAFIVLYGIESLNSSAALAGLIGSFVFSVGIFSTLLGGRLYDVSRHPLRIMLVSNVVGAAALAVFAVPSLLAAFAGAVTLGLSSGVAFTVAFAAGKDMQRAGKDYNTLAISWVNCISLFGAFWPPLVFSYVVDHGGYSLGWLWGAGVSLALSVPLVLLWRESRR